MVGIAFSMLVLIGLVSIAFNFAIRIRLMTHDTTRGKLAWLSCGSSEAWDSYEQLFPGSYIPRLLRLLFWGVIASAVITVAVLIATWTTGSR